MSDVYTIRESLQGKLVDFVREAGFQCVLLEGMIRDLVVALAAYREEDVLLFPEVYVLASPLAENSLPSAGTKIGIRTIRLSEGAATAVLKDCAPLAVGGWSIFLVKDSPTEIRYGLFRSQRHSLSGGTDEGMTGLGTANPVLLIRNRGYQTVELLTGEAARFTAILKSTVPATPELEVHVSTLVDAIVSTLSAAEDFKAYLNRLLLRLIQRCHGTLLAVCPVSVGMPKAALADSTQPSPRIDFHMLHTIAQREKDANSLSDLQAAEALLQGMIGSDGVVVFSSDGKVLAYRAFLKPSVREEKQIGKDGGGRKRTYNLMKLRIPKTFSAVFFRSQDGATGCHRSTNGHQ
ncbi:MAG TPA: hypothetical protein VGU46_07190 [Acidobacteriaceae bacterium]|nr:hypothetical protein [Acidobacteriaceae bacterium]